MLLFIAVFLRIPIIYNIYMTLVYYIYVIQRVFNIRLLDYGYYHYITRASKKVEPRRYIRD